MVLDSPTVLWIVGGVATLVVVVAGISWRFGRLSSAIDNNSADITRHKQSSDKRFDDVETKMGKFEVRLTEQEKAETRTTTLLQGIRQDILEMKDKLNTFGGMITKFLYDQGRKDGEG